MRVYVRTGCQVPTPNAEEKIAQREDAASERRIVHGTFDADEESET